MNSQQQNKPGLSGLSVPLRALLPPPGRARWVTLLALVAVILAAVFVIGSCRSDGPGADETLALPTPTPTLAPTPTLVPTPTPLSLEVVIPAIHAEFSQYRISHFLYEYGSCFHSAFPDGRPRYPEQEEGEPAGEDGEAETQEGESSGEDGEADALVQPSVVDALYMSAHLEAEALDDLPGAVAGLLRAYDDGTCTEEPKFSVTPERGKWLRVWLRRWQNGG